MCPQGSGSSRAGQPKKEFVIDASWNIGYSSNVRVGLSRSGSAK